MAQSPISVRCPVCGQALLASPDLDAVVACPRCRSEGPLRAIVSLDAPLPVRVQSPPPPQVVTKTSHPVAASCARASSPMLGQPSPLSRFRPEPAPLVVEPESTEPARELARRGAALADQAADRFAQGMGFFSQLDEVVDGRRAVVLGAVAIVVLLGSWLDLTNVTTIGLVLFLLTSWSMAAAWAWSLRDEEGVWSWSFAWASIGTKLSAGLEGVSALVPLSGRGLLRFGTRLAFGIGLLSTVASGLLERLHLVLGIADLTEYARTATDVAGTSLFAAAVLGGSLFCVVFEANRKLRAIVLSPGGASTGTRIVDLSRNADHVYRMPPALQEVGKALASWKPRRCSDEAGYAASLRRHLERTLGGPAVLREVWVRDSSGRQIGRIDLVIGDCIAIELKRGLRGPQADRAVGQVMKYLDNWRKGPVLLVVCEAEGGFETAAESARVVEGTGQRALVVAAGPVAR